jgi:hypothetical protein
VGRAGTGAGVGEGVDDDGDDQQPDRCARVKAHQPGQAGKDRQQPQATGGKP